MKFSSYILLALAACTVLAGHHAGLDLDEDEVLAAAWCYWAAAGCFLGSGLLLMGATVMTE